LLLSEARGNHLAIRVGNEVATTETPFESKSRRLTVGPVM
jgi:hypothetical protein